MIRTWLITGARHEHAQRTIRGAGQILSTTVPDDNAIAHLEVLALAASMALKAFEPKVPGGEAKPEVWSNWADFAKRMNEFAQNTAAAAKTATSRESKPLLTTF